MRRDELKRRLDELYDHYDARFVDPDPLQYVRMQSTDADREVVGYIASALAFGNVATIKASIGAVLALLGPRPADAVRALSLRDAEGALRGFVHRWIRGGDVARLLLALRRLLEEHGSLEDAFAAGHARDAAHVGPGLEAVMRRALELAGPLPARGGVRYFFPSPATGGACKRPCLWLRWMVRRGGVDAGTWTAVKPSQLVMPLDAHVIAIARRVKLTRYKSPGWKMALDLTERLKRFDPEDPVKYDFAFHRMGLWKKVDEIDSLRR